MSTTAAAAFTHFCYQCDRPVTIPPAPPSPAAAVDDDFLCPHCSEGFLEELNDSSPIPPNPNPNPQLPFPFADLLLDLENPRYFSAPPSIFQSQSPSFDPFLFLQNHLRNLRAGGASVEFVIENGNGNDLRVPDNIGDYFIGPGFEELIQQLAENDPSRYGTPPASKEAVAGLPSVRIGEEMVGTEMAQCAVCMDEFEVGMVVKELPCKHLYHEGCIVPWLEMHSSCPVCRFELPSEDSEYDGQRRGGDRGVGSSSGGGLEVRSRRPPGISERRLRISLPWPLNMFGFPEGSGTGGSGGGNTGGYGSSSGGWSGSRGGSRSRHERFH